MLWDLSIDPEVNMDEFVNHKLVRDYMNNHPEHTQCVRKYAHTKRAEKKGGEQSHRDRGNTSDRGGTK